MRKLDSFENVFFVSNLIQAENGFFEKEVEEMKSVLDFLTDFLENEKVLDQEVIKGTLAFLESNKEAIKRRLQG